MNEPDINELLEICGTICHIRRRLGDEGDITRGLDVALFHIGRTLGKQVFAISPTLAGARDE